MTKYKAEYGCESGWHIEPYPPGFECKNSTHGTQCSFALEFYLASDHDQLAQRERQLRQFIDHVAFQYPAAQSLGGVKLADDIREFLSALATQGEEK